MGTMSETLRAQPPELRAGGPSQACPVVGGVLATEAPQEFLQEYLKVVMALRYDEKPPYAMLRIKLDALLKKLQVSAYGPIDLHMAP